MFFLQFLGFFFLFLGILAVVIVQMAWHVEPAVTVLFRVEVVKRGATAGERGWTRMGGKR